MDVYTTSFTYPRRSRLISPSSTAIEFPQTSTDGTGLKPIDPFPTQQSIQANVPDVSAAAADAESIQKLAMMALTLHGCHVSFSIVDQGRGWNFLITGAYQQVMITRGLILKECPIQVSAIILPLCDPSVT